MSAISFWLAESTNLAGSLLSGLIGAVLGAAAALAASWGRERRDAEARLRLLLLELQEVVFRGDDHVQAVAGRYIEIMDAVYAVRDAWGISLKRCRRADLWRLAQLLVGRNPADGLEMEYRGAIPDRQTARRIIFDLLALLRVPEKGVRPPPAGSSPPQ